MLTDPVVSAALRAGVAEFMGREFFVAPGVLVPRSVTEVLVRACSGSFEREAPLVFIDAGCGTGIIGISLALHFLRARVVCLDIAPEAVEATSRNIEKHGLASRVEARQSDLFAAVSDFEGKVDAVVSSPPFISTGQLAKGRASLLDLEPRLAFDAGPYGIALHQRLIKEGRALLRPGEGLLVMEFGEGQDRQVRKLVERVHGYEDLREYRESGDRFVAGISARRTAAG